MKRRLRMFDRLDLVDEPIPRQPLVEVYGHNRVLIENHRGVTEYGEERIAVRVSFGNIIVCGRDLMLCRMAECQLVVSGKIESIVLDRG